MPRASVAFSNHGFTTTRTELGSRVDAFRLYVVSQAFRLAGITVARHRKDGSPNFRRKRRAEMRRTVEFKSIRNLRDR